MTFRLFRRNREPTPYGWFDPKKASYIPSAERAWPIRGGKRLSPEEYDALRERRRLARELYGTETERDRRRRERRAA